MVMPVALAAVVVPEALVEVLEDPDKTFLTSPPMDQVEHLVQELHGRLAQDRTMLPMVRPIQVMVGKVRTGPGFQLTVVVADQESF